MSDINTNTNSIPPTTTNKGVLAVSGLYKNWFLEYASYVILDRAVPYLKDGLKPVQRRLLHALKSMDDGRFHKVANVIGQTMQFHPHGDASIYEALVNLGQKDLLIETQGNWGDFRTGDKAAAARYIEARLSKFALAVAFNKENTEWQLSYDGRKKEPVSLPMKFPLLLAQGVEGIAVGLATKILPHNFKELIQASIDILRGKTTNILPDFATGGLADCSHYNGGKRGGKVRVRARMEIKDKKTLLIKEIPYGTTTSSLIDSIIKANDKGKIKIKRVVDNTAKDVEIAVELATNVSPDVTIDALYAFTNCEMSISPNCCVIFDDKPQFLNVNDLLKISTEHSVDLLRKELEIKKAALEEKLHFASLEQIFIEKRIYRKIEQCETFEAVIETIDKGLKRYTKQFLRPITREDIIRLTEIKIKRISKYDTFKAEDLIKELEAAIAEIKHHLAHLTDYAINYFKDLLKKFGKGKERKTEIRSFDTIRATQVAIANQKLYVNRKSGFIGYGLKKEEYVCDCSDIDNIIVFRKDGHFLVTKISDKTFVGKDILYVDVWYKGDDRKIYHYVYYDGASKRTYVKRFAVTGITRDREYNLTQGTKGSRVLYFAAHPNSESEVLTIMLSPSSKTKTKVFDFDFSELGIKGRGVKGNILTYHPIRKITQKSLGASTLGGRKIWLDDTVGRLNTDERGRLLGEFDTNDLILVIYHDGTFEQTDFELTNHYDMSKIDTIVKLTKETVVSVIYYRAKSKAFYAKRFAITTSSLGQKFSFIPDEKGNKPTYVTIANPAKVMYEYKIIRGGKTYQEVVNLTEFIDVKGYKVIGNKLTGDKIVRVMPVVPPKSKGAKAGEGQQTLF